MLQAPPDTADTNVTLQVVVTYTAGQPPVLLLPVFTVTYTSCPGGPNGTECNNHGSCIQVRSSSAAFHDNSAAVLPGARGMTRSRYVLYSIADEAVCGALIDMSCKHRRFTPAF